VGRGLQSSRCKAAKAAAAFVKTIPSRPATPPSELFVVQVKLNVSHLRVWKCRACELKRKQQRDASSIGRASEPGVENCGVSLRYANDGTAHRERLGNWQFLSACNVRFDLVRGAASLPRGSVSECTSPSSPARQQRMQLAAVSWILAVAPLQLTERKLRRQGAQTLHHLIPCLHSPLMASSSKEDLPLMASTILACMYIRFATSSP
jgi:hypothetical protein